MKLQRDMNNIEKKVYNYIKNHIKIKKHSVVLLGVSGGSDSIALFRLMLYLKDLLLINIKVIHIEHGIRGDDSIKDMLFTKELANKYKVPFCAIHVDVLSYKKNNGMSEEEAARYLRYKSFKEKADEELLQNKNVYIAVAHHKEDNVETILLQMLRGTGLRGITGMKEKRDNIIRPLLILSKQEILTYLADKKQEYRDDYTNFDDSFDRNKIRHNILPLFNEINNKAIDHILDMAEKVRNVEEYINYKAKIYIKNNTEEKKLKIKNLTKEDMIIREYVILNFLRNSVTKGKDISKKQVDSVVSLISKENGKSISLSGNISIVKSNDMLYIKENGVNEKSNDKKNTDEIFIDELKPLEERIYNYLGYEIKLRCLKKDKDFIISKSIYTKYLDYDIIKNSLSLRTRQEKDYFFIDEKNHKKTLKKYFIDEKIDRYKRDTVPLLATNHRICYIIGYRMCESLRVKKETENILEITFRRILNE